MNEDKYLKRGKYYKAVVKVPKSAVIDKGFEKEEIELYFTVNRMSAKSDIEELYNISDDRKLRDSNGKLNLAKWKIDYFISSSLLHEAFGGNIHGRLEWSALDNFTELSGEDEKIARNAINNAERENDAFFERLNRSIEETA